MKAPKRRPNVLVGLVALITVAGLILYYDPRPTRGDPAHTVRVRGASTTGALQTQTMVSGLWRVDGSFESTIRIKNTLVVGPLTITPVLYMADGTPYTLPAVIVPKAGVVVVDVNQAVAQAAPTLGSHLSQFGSAALTWQYTSPGHIVASVQMLDSPDSLVFTVPFSPVQDGTAGPQTARGLWWRNDSGVGGYVSLANTTGGAIGVSVQTLGSPGSPSTVQSFQVPGHGTQMLDLDSLTAGIPPGENQAGGIVVQYQGDSGAIIVSGGLVNQSEGYSANMPFCSHDMSSASAAQYTFVSVGVMVGKPDPMMGFPQNTTFQPYAVVRNTTTSPLTLTAQINYMGSAGPVTVNAPPQQLAPLETRQIGLSAILASQGLRNFNGMLNLTFSFNGHPSDAQVATGSVDQTGTYVFEVEPEGLGPGPSKIGGYWNVANGYDTMLNYWNPSSSAEDVVATIYYGDGSGQYQIPLHLAPFASGMIDMMMLIESGQPDANGNVIPMTVQSGSVVFSNAKGKTVPMTLNLAVGAFDVTTATCCSQFVNCCGDSSFTVSPSNYLCPVGQSQQCTASATNCDGTTVYPSPSSWSSSNTAIATITNGGLMTGVAPGQVTITANFTSAPAQTGTFCVPHICVTQTASGSSPEKVTPVITSLSPSRGPVGNPETISIDGLGFGTSPTVTVGTINATVTSSTDTHLYANFTIGSSGGNQNVIVTANSQQSAPANFFNQVPTSLSIVSGTNSTTNESTCSIPGVGTGCGISRRFTYQLNDQADQPIQYSGLQVWDSFGTPSPNQLSVSGFNTTCTPYGDTNGGPCGLTTNSNGQFGEGNLSTCSTVCYSGAACVVPSSSPYTQDAQTWHIDSYSIVQTIKFYCNSVLVNGQ